MNTLRLYLILLLPVSFAFAQGDGDEPNVLVEINFVETSQPSLTELLREFGLEETDGELWESTLALVESKKATQLDTIVIRGIAGEDLRNLSVQEVNSTTDVEASTWNPRDWITPGVTSDPDAVLELPQRYPRLGEMPIPTGFSSRNTGPSISVTPQILDDGKAKIHANIEFVKHAGNTAWMELITPEGRVPVFERPNFYTMRLTTAINIANGGRVLLGSLTPPDKSGKIDPSRKILVFLRATWR